ncbi:ABC-2 type transporter [Desulforamulus reducens MI-1]|uniref:ABC-2 type transporter n=1 Tax=Desulforamulus reducens (strain ATCC BAA-1160 / DSM 100696 / MI-1) TaxID=349161 RepID=A4J912_DESRM|nr:ABC transporter permease [Desulforamulus reducens]ABO51565.1 ABC-2 type transporter [Desulforamulus reducens MI-1]
MKQVFNIACYETMMIFKERILFLLLFTVPLLYATVFGFVYLQGVINHVPLAVVDLDHSKLSREVRSSFANSPHFELISNIENSAQMEQAMREGKIRAAIVIPEKFEFAMQKHQPTELLGVYDASNLIWGYNTRRYIREVTTDFNTQQTAAYLAGLGISENQVKNIMNTVHLNYEVWYNPTFSYATYFYTGLLLMVIHQISLLSISLTVTREKERNTWVQYLSSCLPSWKIFVGKALPYFIVNFFNYALLLWVAAHFVNAKIGGSIGLVLLFGLLFDVIITSLGFYISVLAPNSLQVTRYLMLISVPIFMASGLTWPQTHIPFAVNALASLMPFTWMAEAFRLITVKNLPLAYLLNHLLVLLAMAGVSLGLAMNFKKSRRPPSSSGLVVNSGTNYPGL